MQADNKTDNANTADTVEEDDEEEEPKKTGRHNTDNKTDDDEEEEPKKTSRRNTDNKTDDGNDADTEEDEDEVASDRQIREKAKFALKWTGRKVARVLLYAKDYDKIKKKLMAQGVDSLQLFKPAEDELWNSLTKAEQDECEERAKDLMDGGALTPKEQRR